MNLLKYQMLNGMLEEILKIFRNLIEVFSFVEIGNRFGKDHLVKIDVVVRLACVSCRSCTVRR